MSGLRRDHEIMVVKVLLVVKKHNILIQKKSTTPPPVSDPLQIEKPNSDLVIKPPTKGVLRKSAFNPHARDA